MTLTADASALSYWYTLARACDEGDGAKHIGIGANGLPCLAPARPQGGQACQCGCRDSISAVPDADHGRFARRGQTDVGTRHRPGRKAGAQPAPVHGENLPAACGILGGSSAARRLAGAAGLAAGRARVAGSRVESSPGLRSDPGRGAKRISEAYARLPAGAGTPAKLAAIMQLLCDASALRERLGKEYVDAIRNLLSLEAAQLRFASALRDSGFPASRGCAIRCATATAC